jgi:hypothetical protein
MIAVNLAFSAFTAARARKASRIGSSRELSFSSFIG